MKKIAISGAIGWDYTPQMIAADIASASGEDLEISIASPGGDVFAGIEIFNAIRDYKRDNPKAQILVILKGLVASMASYIAANPAIDLVTAEDNAVLMIHNPWSFAIGDYRAMEAQAEFLSGLAGIMSEAYAKRGKISKKEAQSIMDAESWYFGGEMHEAGFVDEMLPGESSAPPDKDKDKDKKRSMAMAEARLRFTAMVEEGQRRTDARASAQKAAAMVSQIPAPSGNVHIPDGKGEREVEIKTVDDLKANAPEVYKQTAEAAVIAERERIAALDEMDAKAAGKCAAASALVKEAKSDGRNASDIAVAFADLVVAAAESAGPLNTGGSETPNAQAAPSDWRPIPIV